MFAALGSCALLMLIPLGGIESHVPPEVLQLVPEVREDPDRLFFGAAFGCLAFAGAGAYHFGNLRTAVGVVVGLVVLFLLLIAIAWISTTSHGFC